MRLGELLCQKGLITPEQLRTALHEQARFGGRLGTSLIQLRYIDVDVVALALSEQQRLPPVLQEHVASVDKKTLALFPPRMVMANKAIPIGYTMTKPGRVVVACMDPAKLPMEELAFAAGRRIEAWIAPEALMQDCLERYFGAPPIANRYVSMKLPVRGPVSLGAMKAVQAPAVRGEAAQGAKGEAPQSAPTARTTQATKPSAGVPGREAHTTKPSAGVKAAARSTARGLSPPPPPPSIARMPAVRTLEMPAMQAPPAHRPTQPLPADGVSAHGAARSTQGAVSAHGAARSTPETPKQRSPSWDLEMPPRVPIPEPSAPEPVRPVNGELAGGSERSSARSTPEEPSPPTIPEPSGDGESAQSAARSTPEAESAQSAARSTPEAESGQSADRSTLVDAEQVVRHLSNVPPPDDDWDIAGELPEIPRPKTVVSEIPPEPQPVTAPPEALRPVIDRAEASQMLEMATSKDHVGRVLEDWLRSTFGCGLVLVVKGDMAIGWKGFFPDSEDMIEAVAIPLGKPSMFSAAYESQAPFRGVPPAEGGKIQDRLWKLLRCAPPVDSVVCPVVLGKRAVNLIYAHMEDGSSVTSALADEAAALAKDAAAAYVRLIGKERGKR